MGGATRTVRAVPSSTGTVDLVLEWQTTRVRIPLDTELAAGTGVSKRALVDYLEGVADRLVPALRDRPLSVIRSTPLPSVSMRCVAGLLKASR